MAKKTTTRALPTMDEILRREDRKRLMIKLGVRLRKRGSGKLRLS